MKTGLKSAIISHLGNKISLGDKRTRAFTIRTEHARAQFSPANQLAHRISHSTNTNAKAILEAVQSYITGDEMQSNHVVSE